MVFSSKDYAVHTDARGTYKLLNMAFRDSSEFQLMREFFTNSYQATASKRSPPKKPRIEMFFDPKAYDERGIWRLCWGDNGHGMDGRTHDDGSNELVDFFMKYGNSGRPVGPKENGNFGIGAKVCSVPWTDVAVLSWTKDTPEGYGIVIQKNPTSDVYELRKFEVEEGGYSPVFVVEDDPEYGHLKPDWIADEGQGTVVVLLGRNGTEHTLFLAGHPRRDSYKKSDGNYVRVMGGSLDARFAEFPEKTAVRVFTAESAIGAGVHDLHQNLPISEVKSHYRYVKGVVQRIRADKKRFVTEGTVSLPRGFKAHWFLWNAIDAEKKARLEKQIDAAAAAKDADEVERLSKAMNKKSDYYMLPNGGDSFIVGCYTGAGTGGLRELIGYQTHNMQLAKWGLVGPLQQRVGLVIEGPAWNETKQQGVWPNAARSQLHYSGPGYHGGLPFDELAEAFRQKMPPELEAIRREHFRTSAPTDKARLLTFQRKMRKFLTETAKVLTGAGDRKGTDKPGDTQIPKPGGGGGGNGGGGGGPSGPAAGRTKRKTAKGGTKEVRTINRGVPVPDVKMACEFSTDPFPGNAEPYLVRWSGEHDGKEVWVINDQDPYLKAAISVVLKDFDTDQVDEARSLIHGHFKGHLEAHIMAAYGMRERGDKTDRGRACYPRKEISDRLQDDLTLSMLLMDPIRDEQLLRSAVAGLANKAKAKSKAA